MNITAQCAGGDATLEICDITSPANQNLNLFNLLNNNPSSGGSWSANGNTDIFVDQDQGIVNIWDLTQGGVYVFNYTIDNDNCGVDVSSVTLTVGGYPGTDNFTANACEDDTDVNLFQFISNNPNPHFNGIWSDIDNTGGLNGNFLDATVPQPGTYTFTYTVPSVGNCSEKTATVELTIHELNDPGESTDIDICGEDELQSFTNVDLNDLINAGINGNWNESSGTSQISGANDSVIDLQEVFNNLGYGTYNFSITATPSHPICEPLSAVVSFEIRRSIDYSEADLNVEPFCFNELGPNGITVGILDLPQLNGLPSSSLDIGYQISGPSSFQGQTQVNIADPTSFNVDAGFQPSPGDYSITITNISMADDPDELICDIIFDLTTNFEILALGTDDLQLDVDDTCSGEDISVTFTSPDPDLNDDLTLEYDISGANILNDQTADLNFSGGQANFTIDAALFPNVGNHTFIVNSVSDGTCTEFPDLTDAFEVLSPPDTDIDLIVDDVCLGDDLNISITDIQGLTDIEIEYQISGTVNINETINLQVDNNETQFTISGNSFIDPGSYTITIVSITDTDSGCQASLTMPADFEVYAIPSPPDPEMVQEFCEEEQAQVADLLPNHTNVLWYESQTASEPLTDDVLLNDGNYWVARISDDNCTSDRTPVSVMIDIVPDLSLIPEGNLFCGADDPQVQDLTANVEQFPDLNIIWLDGPDGEPIADDTFLMDNESYFGVVSDPLTGCESLSIVEVTVDLTNCDPDNADFLIPDGFSPNGDGINDVFRIVDIQFSYPDYEYEVYNRYGKLLFKGDKDDPAWNGRSSESSFLDGIAPNGVYFYVLHFNRNDRPSQQGRFYLNR